MAFATPALAASGDLGLDPSALNNAITLNADTGETAAATAVVARVTIDGQSWQGTFGDLQSHVPVRDDAHFRTGSIAKTFEAVAMLRLAHCHLVDLDQTVQHYLPGLLPAAFQPITVRQLLNHTSGLPEIDEGATKSTADELIDHRFGFDTFDQIIQRTLRPVDRPWPGPRFAPGERQEYNSLGYRIAGNLIEHLSGEPYGQVLQEQVLDPVGLDQTIAPTGVPDMPQPYLHGYLTRHSGEIVDVSSQGSDPSSIISTLSDIDTFFVVTFPR